MERLRVAKDCRHLETVSGKRTYLIGDTTWELFHRLTLGEAEEYLTVRREQGFNFIQAVILAEFEGLTVPNAYGRFPLLQNERGEYDPTLPDLSGEYTDDMILDGDKLLFPHRGAVRGMDAVVILTP